MRKGVMWLMLMVAGTGLFAAPVTLTMLVSGGDVKNPEYVTALALLQKDYPGTKLELSQMNLATGSTMTMDAWLAAGTPPNIYYDNMVRASKYMVPEYALDLTKYIRDLNKYQKSVLAGVTRNGKMLGMPIPAHTQGMCINLDLMKEIGFEVKWDWTTDDFLKMCELVKAKYGTKKYGTMLFGANQSGDYLLHNWFEAFGAHYYMTSNYDTSTIAKTGGAKAYAWYQKLITNGYVDKNAAVLNDDDYALEWSKGNLAAAPFFVSWVGTYQSSALSQKLIDKPFPVMFVPFPRGSGVKKVPGYSMTGSFVVWKSPNEQVNKVAARFVEYFNGAKNQEYLATLGVPPNRTDVAQPNDPLIQQAQKIGNENGIYDCGLIDPRFTERRSLQYPILQKLFTFKMTPEEAIAAYDAALSAVK